MKRRASAPAKRSEAPRPAEPVPLTGEAGPPDREAVPVEGPFLYFLAADEKRIGWRGRTCDEAYDAYVAQEGTEPDFILGVLDDRPKHWRYEVLWESEIPEGEP